jgi:hypothetical protein
MENIITILVVGILNVVCLFCGLKVGMSVVKGEPIELPSLPSINPLKAYREREERKEAEREQETFDTIMQNIEAYNGTSANQKDVSK